MHYQSLLRDYWPRRDWQFLSLLPRFSHFWGVLSFLCWRPCQSHQYNTMNSHQNSILNSTLCLFQFLALNSNFRTVWDFWHGKSQSAGINVCWLSVVYIIVVYFFLIKFKYDNAWYINMLQFLCNINLNVIGMIVL